MIKKTRSLGILTLSIILLSGCPAPITVNTSPSPTVTSSPSDGTMIPTPTPTTSDNGNGTTPTPTPSVSFSSNPNPTPSTTSSPTTPILNLPKISFSGVSIREGNIGNVVTVKGTNFISGKLKNVIFTNSANAEMIATVAQLSENEVTFTIPSNTLLNIPAGSFELTQGYQFLKIFFLNENSERVLINDSFKVFFNAVSSGGGGGGGGGGGTISTPTPTPTATPTSTPTATPTNGNINVVVDTRPPSPVSGNVNVQFNPNQPTQTQFGTVAGILRSSADNSVISGATVTVFNSSGVQVGQGLTQADGAYAIQSKTGTGYYVTFNLNGYTLFNYYLNNLAVTNNTMTNIENLYLTLTSVGVRNISGRLEDVNGVALANAVIKFFNGSGNLIMTGRTGANGEYLFNVPFANDGYFLINYANFRDFFYYVDINDSTLARFATFCLTPTNDSTATASITGQIFDAVSRQGIALTVIDVTTDTGKIIFSGRANATGNYNFSFRSGRYGGCVVRRRGYGTTFVNNLDAFGAGVSPNLFLVNEANFGIGGVLGFIVDSQNQSDVSGLTLRVRSGINNKTGSLVTFKDRNNVSVTSTVSGPRGAYAIDGIDAGNYTVEIVGKTIILNGQALVYSTSYFNVLIVGNDTTQTTGTVTRN